jgi:hypothetical protein
VTDWESIVDAAIRRTETSGVSPIRAVPIDLIAAAVWREVDRSARGRSATDADLDAALAAILRRNGFPVPVQLSPPLRTM